MKLLVVLCSLAAYAVTVWAHGYLPGKEYVYKYKAKIFAELDEQHHQHAGVAFKSEVHVQPHKDFFVVKINHVVYDKLNERVTKERGYDFNYKENNALSEALQKPFVIHFEHGLVHHIKVAEDDPIWSVNLKKSLASLFQVNFEQVNAVRHKNGQHLDDPKLDAHYFKVMEDSLYGECETIYEVSHEPSHLTAYTIPVLNVTKSTNFGHCAKLPYYRYDSVNYAQCVDCESDLTNPDRLSNVMHFNLRGDRHNFVVEKVHTESEFTHMPWTREGDMANVHTNRTLILVDEREVKEELQVVGDGITHFNLHFHYEGEHGTGFTDQVDLKAPHFYFHFLGKSADVDVVGKAFNDLVNPLIDGTFGKVFEEHRAPAKFVEIVKQVGTLGYDDIEKIYKTYVDVSSDDPQAILHRAQLFIEILGASGTNPAFLFAKNHLFEPIVLPNVADSFIQMLPYTIKEASETLFDEIDRLCESDDVVKKPKLQSSCYLALSSVVHEHCVGKNYIHAQKHPNTLGATCSPEIAKKYFKAVVHHFEDDNDHLRLITAIKAAGNFGLLDGLDYLKKYIEDDHHISYFRVAAIWGLRRTVHAYPEQVLEVLVPVYFNHSEPHEVRIAAFSVIMTSRPSRAILEAIGVGLHEEHNHQVESYVSSAFAYLAHSDYPCHQKIKRDLEHVLRHVLRLDSQPHFDFRHSQYWQNAGFNEDYGFGGLTGVSYVTSNDSYIPSKIYIGASDYVADRHIESVNIVFNQEGLDKVVDRILGPEGLFKKNKSIFDLFRRRVTRETASVEKELKEIDETLHIKTRHEREIHGDLSVRMFGHEISFFYFNETLFEDFIREGLFGVPDLQDILKNPPSFLFAKHALLVNSVLILPSCVGFPIFLAYQEPSVVFYHNNEFKFEVTPNVFAEDRNNESPSAVHVLAKGRYIHDTVRRGVLGISLTFEHTTVGVGIFRRSYFNLPVKADVTIDLKTQKLTLKHTPVTPNNLIHVCAQPFTYVDNYANAVEEASETGYLPYWKLSEMGEYHEKYGHDYLGVGVDVKAKYGKLHVFQTHSHARKFWADHSLRDIHYLLHFNPHVAAYDMDINITAADTNPTSEVHLEVSLDYHGHGSNKAPFHSENYDGHHADLEDHAKALPGRKFYTYVLKGELVRQSALERKAVLEATYTHSCDHKLQKYTLYYDRSPYTLEETQHFKICANAYMRYPDYDMKKLHDLDTLELDQKVAALAKIGFGNDCKSDKTITVHGVLSRSPRQIELEAKREVIDPLHFNPFAHYYDKCKEEHTHGIYYGHNCRVYIYYATRFNHYDIDVDFGFDFTPVQKNQTKAFFGWLDHKLYPYSDTDYNVGDRKGKLELHLDFSPVDHTVNIEILKRYATTHYDDVPVSEVYKPVSGSPYISFTNRARFNGVFRNNYCSLEGEFVRTFDNVTFQLPDMNCWTVLAKDCSEHEYFLVLGKKTTNVKHPKSAKIFLGKAKVEILTVTDDGDLIVRVNGKKVEVDADTPYFYHSEGEHGAASFYVTFNGLYYTVNSPKYGVTVFLDGKAIVTELSSYYRGKQCGVCGDFNHEHDREFRGPEDCVYHNASEFAAAYAIHEDGCHAPEVKHSGCEKPRSRDPCTILRNKYVYVGTTNRQLCFSTIPLPECSPECLDTRKVTRTVGYHCLPAKESYTRNLQRLSRQRILHELTGKLETHFSEDTFPESCTPIQF